MAYIYSITNTINQKIYIGLTRRDNPYDRWKEHIQKSNKPEYAIHRAMYKYGVDNFKFRVLEECDSSKVEEREIHYIKKFNTFFEGYNSTSGGTAPINDVKPITRYSKKGEQLDHFASLMDAVSAVNGDKGAISKCANGLRFSAYGYRWSWKGEALPIVKTKYLHPICAYNKKGMYKEWTSIAQAERETKCDHRSIRTSIESSLHNKKQCKGWYYFKLTENKIDFSDITFAERYKPTTEKAKEMVRIRTANKH